MAIRPPSDIVLDVARAADPLQYEAAKSRLHSLARPGGTAAFDEVVDDIARRSPRGDSAEPVGGYASLRRTTVPGGSLLCGPAGGETARSAAAYRSFEAMTLKTVVEAMLPQETGAVFGQGLSGDVWRSMLAEQVSVQIAQSGGVGIAERLARVDAERDERTSARSVVSLAEALAPGSETAAAAALRHSPVEPPSPVAVKGPPISPGGADVG